jgi:hypothetical protein
MHNRKETVQGGKHPHEKAVTDICQGPLMLFVVILP